ncbi:MAG: cysteine--tRNA ligase [Eubacteriales bacterium]|nr:cysteine--tRNA ligase [Eubacteriales bacterium]
MKIHNTLSGQKEEFIPLTPGKVKMYVCGPTVYNYIHIGNARPLIVFDTVRRYFEYCGYEVNFVSNFTDVDDKIIQRANEENTDATTVAETYIAACKADMEALNIREATHHPRATEEIDGMIQMIEELIAGGHAYEQNGSVFFRTRSFDGYGKLSGKNIDDLISGARIGVDEDKEDPLDFVLWKPKKPGEPAWDSPWGAGRPGWHIECSVMSKRYLGEEIDIHAGGEDLIFPHHENEIAQSEACSHKTFARYWMHNGFLKVDNKKMSKSLGNFYTIDEVLARYDGQVLRMFMLSANYHGPINFSWDGMEATKTARERIMSGYALLGEKRKTASDKPMEATFKQAVDERIAAFEAAMNNDFNTADALTQLFELTRICNTDITSESGTEAIDYARDAYDTMADVLGLIIERREERPDAEILALIEKRTAAKKARDFAAADAIRDELAAMGIVLEDTREGVRWKRV